MENIKQQRIYGIVCGVIFISFLISCSSRKNHSSLIEVSSSGCFGTCPVLDLKLKDNKIYYNLIFHNNNRGLFSYELKPFEKNKIDSLFNYVKLDSLKKEYISSRVDMPTFNVFIKTKNNNKRVYFYADDAPKEFEDLIYYLIGLSKNDLTKLDTPFSISTRMGMEVIKIPPPPPPPIDNSDLKNN
ncbi:DUF6438 domain-containing protein [Flavobacteriaceae bacterium]|nr:DUF6438 domain-containing protein [Flavobacteriaceae bacterium]